MTVMTPNLALVVIIAQAICPGSIAVDPSLAPSKSVSRVPADLYTNLYITH